MSELQCGNTSVLTQANLSRTRVVLLEWIPPSSKWVRQESVGVMAEDQVENFSGADLLFGVITVARRRPAWVK
jgi:hypothetical protein